MHEEWRDWARWALQETETQREQTYGHLVGKGWWWDELGDWDWHIYITMYKMGFQGGAVVKNPPANTGDAGDVGLIPGSRRSPGEGNGNLLQCSCMKKFHGQRSLAGYSPWGCKALVFLGFTGDWEGKESACNAGDLGSISGLGTSPGGGHGPLQYSCIGESPWTEEPGRLQSMGSQIVRHDWATKHSAVLSFIDVIWLIALTPYLLTDSGVSGFYLLLSTLTFFLDIMTGQWLSLYIYFSTLVTGSFLKKLFLIEVY